MERITERKLKNKKFRDTETSILLAISSAREVLSVGRLIKIAGISRSTFYRHHQNVYEIIPDYEKYILRKYRSAILRFTRIRGIHMRTLYERTFIFMANHRKILQFLSEHDNKNFTFKMLLTLEPKSLASGKVTNSEMFAIYAREVSAIIEEWQQNGFQKSEILTALDKISYLTNTARSRLGPITGPTKNGG